MNDVEKEVLVHIEFGKHEDIDIDRHDVAWICLDILENLHKFGVNFIIRDFVSQLVPKTLKEVV